MKTISPLEILDTTSLSTVTEAEETRWITARIDVERWLTGLRMGPGPIFVVELGSNHCQFN